MLLTFGEFLAYGTVWFWIFFVAAFLAITYFVENDNSSGWLAFLCFAGLLTLMYFLGSAPIINEAFTYIVSNPFSVLLMAVFYFIIGSVWSIAKWYFFLKELQYKDAWPTSYEYREVLQEGKKGTVSERVVFKLAPKAKEYKSTILMWMSWWPFSALWTMVNNPVRRVFEWIYRSMEKTFDNLSERIFKDSQASNETK